MKIEIEIEIKNENETEDLKGSLNLTGYLRNKSVAFEVISLHLFPFLHTLKRRISSEFHSS